MTNKINRRTLIRGAASGTAFAGLTAALGSSVQAFGPEPERKMLIIFQRGGNDGLNTLVPTGATAQQAAYGHYSAYSAQRPGLHLYPSNSTTIPSKYRAISLQHSTAELHPALKGLIPIYNSGHLACIHRVGALGLTLSHFTAQHHWETGRPDDLWSTGPSPASNYHRGWVSRYTGSGPFSSASLSSRQQQLFDTTQDAEIGAHLRRLFAKPNVPGSAYSYSKSGAGPHTTLQSVLPAGLAAQAATGAMGNGPLRSPLDSKMRVVTEKAILSEGQVSTSLPGGYTPFAGTYPVSGPGGGNPDTLPAGGWVTEFGDRLKDAAALLKNTSTKVVGVELGGWDTHSDQVDSTIAGNAMGRHQRSLAVLGAGMKAIYDDVNSDPNAPNLITLVVSEFGRTVKENSSLGTDHGYATTAFVMGKFLAPAAPRIFNFDALATAPWNRLAVGDLTNGNAYFNFMANQPGYDLYMMNRTDPRAIIREILVKHFGVADGTVTNSILPGLAAERVAAPNPEKGWYDQLGFL